MMDKEKILAICQECGEEFNYVLKPGYPRKYCVECSAKKKADYEDMQNPENMQYSKGSLKALSDAAKPEVVRPGEVRGIKIKDVVEGIRAEYLNKQDNKYTAMYVSYAKDVFIALDPKNGTSPARMELAIELVKQAIDAFTE